MTALTLVVIFDMVWILNVVVLQGSTISIVAKTVVGVETPLYTGSCVARFKLYVPTFTESCKLYVPTSKKLDEDIVILGY